MCGTKSLSIFSLCLILFSILAGSIDSASAQQPEKRIALVVGDGAYTKSPLATAANDAGLIAQTLQAAGFDVVGARDLDGDTLRSSFRDFIQKAQASGPGTVAMVYLAGYGIQLAGENYFIPVDSQLSRDVDIPTEGLRISDYLRQLASLPLKASIVVLDAARQQPFIEGGQSIASGLALVDPEPQMLIAYNAAPGTVAPSEPGPYGVYAQSLAEMIRTGGLPLPDVFNHVRLRVNEVSKGAQVPWDAGKIDASFTFFDRAPDAPAQAAPDQAAAIRNKPIRDLGAQDAYAAALERDTLPAYEDFLAAYPADPLARRVRAIVAARREAITWLRSYRADTPQAYWSYLRRYPRGPHAYDARRRLAILTAPLEPPPSFAVMDYDVPPPPPDEIVYVDRPVLMFSDPDFDFAPPPPPPVFFLPPPPPDFVVLAPPIVAVGLFILPQPCFVPIPTYVRPPVYVAPPPNNIIFANIHNTTVINNVINQAPAATGTPTFATRPGGPSEPAKGGPGQGTVTPVNAGPTLPHAAVQKATLIQEKKVPPPPSTLINHSAPAGTAGAPSGQKGAPPTTLQTNVSPTTLPADKTLPGMKGGSALPKGGPTGPAPGLTNPGAKLAPENKSATTPPVGSPSGGAVGTPKMQPTTGPVPAANNPTAKLAPNNGSVTSTPAGAGAGIAGGPNALRRNPRDVPPPPPSVKPAMKPAAMPARPTAMPARPTPPVAAVQPPHRVAPPPPPPRPAPQMARPMPQMARPAPQMARPAPPPPRPAPPPPTPHPVAQIARPAAPPPRPPAPPPARPAAVKKCPPNVPRC